MRVHSIATGAPILLRLAWADAGTYDKARAPLGWPNAGGCVGGIRTRHALEAPPNAGLMEAISTYLSPIKEVCPEVLAQNAQRDVE